MRRKLEDLTRQQIYAIAQRYADSRDEISAAYYCEQFSISEAVFYHCLEKAVEESMVSIQTANKIAEKAGRNAARHAGEAGRIKSLRHYQEIIDARENFKFKRKEQKKYTEMYSNSILGFEDFCRVEHISLSVMRDTVLSAIKGLLVDDECVERMHQKSKERFGDAVADKFFGELKEARKATLALKKEHEKELRKARMMRKKQES